MSADQRPHAVRPMHNFGWCAAAYAAGYGVTIDPGLAMVLGSALWLGAARGGALVDPLPTSDPDDDLHLSGLNPRAMELLADSLRAPLFVFRQRDAGQLGLLRSRAAAGRRTLATVSARLFDPEAPRLRTASAVIESIVGDGDAERVLVRAGADDVREVATADLLAHWIDDGAPGLDAEWFVWMPAAPGAVGPAEAWPLITTLALTRQLSQLSTEAAAFGAPSGDELLRRLEVDARSAGRGGLRDHTAMLARSTSVAGSIGGPGLVRHALAGGIDVLARHSGEPELLAPLASALTAAGDEWDRVCGAAAVGELGATATLATTYARLRARELAIIETLERALSATEVTC